MRNRITVSCLLLSSMGVLAQSAKAQLVTPTILQLDETNLVNYSVDVSDLTKASASSAVTSVAAQTTFQDGTGLGDIVAANGVPVKGTHIIRYTRLNSTPTPSPGQAIADVTRATLIFHFWEILGADGTAIGTITAQGLSSGAPPPGAPASQTSANLAITGGTGAFAGVRGVAGSTNPAGSVPNRQASFIEDPSRRRINGGGTARYFLTLYPVESPTIANTPNGPAITHSSDFSLVSAAKPATAGETLSLFAFGLGPVRATVDPGQPFPSSPLAAVNAPVAVTVSGVPATVLAATGYPGGTDGYQVNFQLPPGTPKGTAQVQVSAAWMVGPAVTINVR